LININSKQKNPHKQAGFLAVVIGLLVFGVAVTGTYAYKHRSFVLNKFKQFQNFSKSNTNPSVQLATNTDEKAVSSKQEREPEGQVLSVVDNKSYINQAVIEEFQRLVASGALTGPQGVKGEKGDKGENSETRNTSQNYPVGLPSNNLGQVLGATITATPSYNPPSPQGPTTTNIPSIQQGYVPVGLVPNNDQGFNGAVLGGFTSLGAKNLAADSLSVTGNFTSTGSASISNLSVSSALSSASVNPATANTTTEGLVLTQGVAASVNVNLYQDAQKQIALTSDNLPYFIHYSNTSGTDLYLVKCADVDCLQKTSTLVATSPSGIGNYVIKMGSDNLPRILYVAYETPQELHLITCTNATCSANTNTLIDVSTSVGYLSFYSLAMYLDSNNFAHIFYDNFQNSNQALRYARCSDVTCSSKTLTTVTTGTTPDFFEALSIAQGLDGFPRVAYTTANTTIKYIQCTNASCSAIANTVIDSTGTYYYELDMQVASDGFGRIAYTDYTTGIIKYVQCTNASCSTNVINTVNTLTNPWGVSLVLGSDDTARIVYDNYRSGGVYYTNCKNASCSVKNTKTISSTGKFPVSVTMGSDNFARLIYTQPDLLTIDFVRLKSTDGNPTQVLGSVLGTSTSPFGQVFSNGLTLYENSFFTTNKGVLSIGNNPASFDGSTTGFFSGSENGTLIAANAASGYAGNLIDLQVAGVSKFKVDSTGAITFNGAITLPTGTDLGNLIPRSVTRTVPTTIGDAVDIGSFYVTELAAVFEVYISVPASNFSVAKKYTIPARFGYTGGNWYVAMADQSTGNYSGNDYELDVNMNAFTTSFRIRRTGGSTAGTAYVTILQQGATTSIWTPSSATSTVASLPTQTLDYLDRNLRIVSLQPGSVGSGNGTAAANVINVTGGAGGDSSAAGSITGGTGGAILLTTGAGGQATAATTAATGGTGGAYTLQGGTGGASTVSGGATNTGGTGSALTFNAGTGGAASGGTSNVGGTGGAIAINAGTGGVGTTSGGNGGAVTIQGGQAAAMAGAAGGAITLTGRAGSSTGTGGAGGAITLTAGAAGGDDTVTRTGGSISLTAGASKGNTAAGGISITGGAASQNLTSGTATGPAGGSMTFTLGAGGTAPSATTASTGGSGGTFNLQGANGGVASVAGTGTNTGGAGSALNLTGGVGGNATGSTSNTNTGGPGGSITITGGAGGNATTGSGTLQGGAGGGVTIQGGTGGSGTIGGNGGLITIVGGNAQNVAGSAGGSVQIIARQGSSTGSGGAGGALTLNAGAAGGDDTVARAGGLVSIAAGGSKGNTAGGSMSLTPGSAGQNLATGTASGPASGAFTISISTGGTAPNADVASTGGAGGTFTIQGGTGGAASVAGTGTNTGGVGYTTNWTLGTGGAANGATSGTNTGGSGGGFNLTGGTGGAASNGSGNMVGGTGGALTFTGGTGGVGTTSGGNGGAVTLQGGVAAAMVGAAGGAVSITGRTGSSTGSGGAGGAVAISSGAAGGNDTVSRAGGAITITSGASKGDSVGSAITLTSGAGGLGTGATGAIGGAVTLQAGAGGANATTSGAGGDVNIRAGVGGSSGSAGSGGAIILQTATTTSLANRLTIDAKGNVVLGTGALSTSATDGFIYVPASAGTPTGVPTSYSGRAATEYDTTNNKLCSYNGAWKCSGAFADIAEWMPASGAESGDLVSITDLPNPTEDPTARFMLGKSKGAYDVKIIGVVSRYAEEEHMALGYARSGDYHAVALAGRIPVKVTNENGEIKKGDYLTSSKLFPGYAMKALRSGYVIGQALEEFSGYESGFVMIFVKPGFQVINNTFTLEPEDGQLTSQLFKIETNNQDTALLVNQKGSGNLLTLQREGIDTFIVKNNGSVLLTSNIQEVSLPVLNISNQDKKLFVVYASGNLEITGNIKVSKNTSGKALLKLGDNRVKVKFSKPYSSVPNVFVTLTGLPPVAYSVIEKTPEGFTIALAEPATSDRIFEWLALEQPEETDSESSLIIDFISPSSNSLENNNSQAEDKAKELDSGEQSVESESVFKEPIEAENNISDIIKAE